MKRRTVRDELDGRCRIHFNFGGGGCWVSFDYAIRPDPSAEAVRVEIGDSPDEETTRWFPDIRRGIATGLQSLRDHDDIDLVGVRITITKIYTHPIDTTPRACELYGSHFLIGFGRDASRCVPAYRDGQEPG